MYFETLEFISIFALVKTKHMAGLSYEEFLDQAWDYVSENVVSDEYWENNSEFIKELTFDAYTLYRKSIIDNGDGSIFERLTPKLCGKFMECFFSRLMRDSIIS